MSTENSTVRNPNFVSLWDLWTQRREEILKRTKSPEYPFGLKSLDDVAHGVMKGKVTVIAARTSEAKTAFALQAAFNMANIGKTILYITLEDDSKQIAERLFSNIREIDNQALITGDVARFVLFDPGIEELFKRVKLLPLQDYGHNFDEIKNTINLMQPKPDIVFLDYVQMIEQLPRESEYDSLSRFSQQCKKFAEVNDIGLVIISQINRAGAKEGRPQLHHLQGCGRLEQVSDLLLILYCPYTYRDTSFDYDKTTGKGYEQCPPDYVECMIAKNKNGIRNWVVRLRFTGKYYKFEEWTH